MKIRKWCNRLLTLGLLTALISSTITGTVAVFQEKSGCIRFDGVNDYVDAGNDASLNITDAITIETWIYWRGGVGHQGIVVKNAGAGNQSYQLKKHHNPLAHGWFWVYTTDGIFVTGKFIPTTDRWYHLVGTYDGTKVRFYVDAMLDEEAMASGTILPSDANLFIANWSILNRSFNGLIDEVRIYNRALDSLEIQYNYSHRLPYDTTGLVLWLKMNECVGDTAFDYSGHGNHGVLMNNPLWRWESPFDPFEAIIQ